MIGVCFGKKADYALDARALLNVGLIKNIIRDKHIILESFKVEKDTIVYKFGKGEKRKRGSITRKISKEGEELSSNKFLYPRSMSKSKEFNAQRKIQYNYDKLGNIIEKKWIIDNNKKSKVAYLEYDSKNRLINEVVYNADGKIISNSKIEHEVDGALLEYFYPDIKTQKFQSKYKWSKNYTEKTRGSDRAKFELYDNERLTNVIIEIVEGSVKHLEYYYDNNGNIIKITYKENDNIYKEDKILWENGLINKIIVSIIGNRLENLPKKEKLYPVEEYKLSNYRYFDFSKGSYNKGNRSGTWIKYHGTKKEIKYTYKNKNSDTWNRNYDYIKYYKGKVIERGGYRASKLEGYFEQYNKKPHSLSFSGKYSKGLKNGKWQYYKTNSSNETYVDEEITFTKDLMKSKKKFMSGGGVLTETIWEEPVTPNYLGQNSSNYATRNWKGLITESYKDGKFIKYYPSGVISESKNDYFIEKFNEDGTLSKREYIGAHGDFFNAFLSSYPDTKISIGWTPWNFPKLWAVGETWKGYMVGEWSFYYHRGEGYYYIEGEDMPLYTKISYNQTDASIRNDLDIPFSGISSDQQIITYHLNGKQKQNFFLWLDSDGFKYHDVYEEWYDNGQLKKRFKYDEGHLVGLAEIWHNNGKKAVEANFKYPGIYDEKNSLKRWYDNGLKKEFYNFHQFISDNGTTTEDDNYGKLFYLKYSRYDNDGELIEKKKFKKGKNGGRLKKGDKGYHIKKLIKGSSIDYKKNIINQARNGLENNKYFTLFEEF